MCNLLKGKIIVFDGDSICHATSETKTSNERGWAYRIGNSNEMEWCNFGIGGGTITAELYSRVTGNPRHWISRSIDAIHERFPKLDYLILEGGTNDADLVRHTPERVGIVDETDFTGNYDDTTFCGAVESLFFKALRYYPTAKIGFIIAPKMGLEAEDVQNRRSYFFKIMEICRKWNIPYIDLWDDCPLDPTLKTYYDSDMSQEENIASGKAYVDGQHLSKIGYDLITPKIETFIKTL